MERIRTDEAASVRVEGVCKHFGEQTVLNGIDFEVEPGETFVIMGPSGSGKSVLLKHIVGLMAPDSGSVHVNGHNVQDKKTREAVVSSMVFQAGALFNSMSVYDNLAFYPREHKLYGRKRLKEEVTKTLRMLSLEDAAAKYPSQLSGGMKKRVAIARSLMVRPQLMLYDEPTSELDPIMAATISEIIATLKEEVQVTSIVVSHDTSLAKGIADRVAIMFGGKLHVVAGPDELDAIEDPKVREFLNPEINLKNPRFKRIED